MKRIAHRMICLNLALVMILALAVAALGGESQDEAYTITLYANGGKFGDGSTQRTTIGEVVTLPTELNDDNDPLLGWCTDRYITASDLFRLPGSWFQGGSRIEPKETPIVLYAQEKDGGRYAVYYPTKGVLQDGGNMMVYGIPETTTELVDFMTPGAETLVAPEGYEFVGWTTGETETVVGKEISLKAGETIHLYAQWKALGQEINLSNGLTLVWNETDNMVYISGSTTAAKGICAFYTSDDQLLNCILRERNDGTIELSTTCPENAAYCKVFLLDSNYAPVAEAAEYAFQA